MLRPLHAELHDVAIVVSDNPRRRRLPNLFMEVVVARIRLRPK